MSQNKQSVMRDYQVLMRKKRMSDESAPSSRPVSYFVRKEEMESVIDQLTAQIAELQDVIERLSSEAVSKKPAILGIQSTGGLQRSGETVNLDAGQFIYFGQPTSNGTWRLYVSGTDIVAERLESGSWVAKGGFTA